MPKPSAKTRVKAAKRLSGMKRDAGGIGRCWVCGSAHGLKTARMARGPVCRKCLEADGIAREIVERRERLKAEAVR